MSERADHHLALLSGPDTLETLAAMELDWSVEDRSLCAALRFKRHHPKAPAVAALLGGASSGKSTLFNTLLGREVSRISAHAHETLGPLLAVHDAWLESVRQWIAEGCLLSDLHEVVLPPDDISAGSRQAATLVPHGLEPLSGTVMVDTPDVTSKMSADEGSLTRRLLPWFDRLVIVVDEERWFDAAVFDEHTASARDLGQALFVVFNRTAAGDALRAQDLERLGGHARACHATAHHLSPFEPGTGYRPLSASTRREVLSWMSQAGDGRRAELEAVLQRRSSGVVRANLERNAQFTHMSRTVEKQVQSAGEEAHLTTDLLTGEERELLGLGYRFLPLYEVFRTVRRRFAKFSGALRPDPQIDFEKRTEELAAVLRRNLEHRFGHATDRIDQIVLGSAYLRIGNTEWTPGWQTPAFDEHAWASRVRAHIDAWKAETTQHARQSDLAALLLGVPLLVADLLFLGGAGVSLAWAATSLAGFFGGKGLVKLAQRSPALRDYQATVRAYQSLLCEALTEQWRENLTRLPRRHLKMDDPTLQALMYWSAPAAMSSKGETRS